jgi:capsid protein
MQELILTLVKSSREKEALDELELYIFRWLRSQQHWADNAHAMVAGTFHLTRTKTARPFMRTRA